jgi:SET domain-containing protein
MNKRNHRYEVKRTATGLGLFAAVAIPARKRIIEYTGPLIPNEEVERRRTGKYFFGLNDKHSIDGTPRTNTARYINHSCRPNAEAIISGGRVWIWSKRNIKAGEEITYDYGREYFDEHIKPKGCKCKKCAPKQTSH